MAYRSFWVLIHLTCAVSTKSKCIYLHSTPLLSLNFTMPALNIGARCCHCLFSVCQWMQSKAFVSSVCHSVQHSPHSTCPRTLVHKQTSNYSSACLLGLGAVLHRWALLLVTSSPTSLKPGRWLQTRRKECTIQRSSTVECIWYLWRLSSIILGTEHGLTSCQLVPIASAHNYSKKRVHPQTDEQKPQYL